MMWMIYETFRDIKLLARVREEIASAFRKDDEIINMKFDSQTLEALPLIKSIYAETLRLRIHVYCVRYTGNQDLEINDWVIPKERVLLVATAPAHMDETFWNTKDGGYPLDTFWSDRFLVDPSDPQSGPVKPTHRQHVGAIDSKGKTTGEAGQVRFSLDGTEGQWIPYGGGTRSCPGRFYSKHVMVAACAMMASFFDVEILADETAGKMNPLFYGFGGQHPIEKIPFRIRKRATEERGGSSR